MDIVQLEVETHLQTVDHIEDDVEHIIASVINPVVRRKLHVTLRPIDTSGRNQDALELVGDVRLAILGELHRRAASNGGIQNLPAYAVAIASNACYQYLREQFPERMRLRNKFRYLLSHDPNYAIWKNSQGQWLCGLAEFAGRDDRSKLSFDADDFPGGDDREACVNIANAAFRSSDGPISFDEMIDSAASMLGINEPFELSTDLEEGHHRTVDPAIGADSALELRSRVNALWSGILKLLPVHRKALLLNLRDPAGDNLLAVLPLTGVADLKEVSAALEISQEEMLNIWNSLPWDDSRIADYMGLRRQQVINLRQTARTKLLRWEKESGNI